MKPKFGFKNLVQEEGVLALLTVSMSRNLQIGLTYYVAVIGLVV